MNTTATALTAGDLLLAGHGYGEAPAWVLAVGQFTRRTVVATLTDGNGTRSVTWAADQPLDRGPRASESIADLVDYDLVRDSR